MSGLSIDRKVQNALGKVAVKVGYSFDHYRPDNQLIPMADRNLIATVKVGFSQDEGYSKNPDDVLQYYKIYMRYSDVLPNDILYSTEAPATLVVLQVNPLRGPVGVKCTHFIDIKRPVSTPTLDKKISLEDVGQSIPCAVQYQAGSTESGSMSSIPTSVTSGKSNVKVWLGVPAGFVKINDILVVDSYQFRVKSVTTTNGTDVIAESIKAGV